MNRSSAYLLSALLTCLPSVGFAVEPHTEMEIVYDGGDRDPLNSADIDVDGNVYLSGARGNSNGATSNTYYLAKYDSFGREQWVSTYVTGTGSSYGPSEAIDVDRDGNVYMVISESYNFGRIIKFDAQGAHQELTLGSTVPYAWDHSVGIQVQRSGDIFVRKGNSVEQRDNSGALVWSKLFLDHWSSSVRDMEVDSSNNLYAVGKVWNGSENTNNAGVMKIDSFGNELWRYQLSGQSDAYRSSLDSSGNLVVAAIQINSSGNWDMTLLKLSPSGALLSNQSYDFGGSDLVTDFALDENDFRYALIKGAGGFITVKIAPDGTQLWSQTYYPGRKGAPSALAVDIHGGVFVTGGYGNYDQKFVTIKYDQDGVEEWLKIDGEYGSRGQWIRYGRTGEVYVAGAGRFSSSNAHMFRYRVCPCTTCQ